MFGRPGADPGDGSLQISSQHMGGSLPEEEGQEEMEDISGTEIDLDSAGQCLQPGHSLAKQTHRRARP